MSLLISGGDMVTASELYKADVFVENGNISVIAPSLAVGADEVIDATGKYVLPGGIDPHTHLHLPFMGTETCDTFETGHAAAAFGGTTCHIEFVLQPIGSSLASALDTWRARLDNAAIIDTGFHMAVTDLRDDVMRELRALPDQGITSFKMFMAYKGSAMLDDEGLFKAMRVAGETGALAMVHAENGHIIDLLVREALAAGHTQPRWHALTRPPAAEAEATNRAIEIAHLAQAPLYVVHVSCEEALAPITTARERGWPVWAETCTQYLLIDDSYLDLPDFEGAKYVFSPPPRAKSHQAKLWEALRRETLSVVSTDHCPFNFHGQKDLGRDDFSKIPNGSPGIENRLPLMHEFGVRAGRISITKMVELLSTRPAQLFGLYPRKGTIAVGSDADLVVFDPAKKATISATTHHSNIDYSLYEGVEVTGMPEYVIRRGEIVVSAQELRARPGSGRFVERDRFAAPV